jgi:mycothiol synthase
VLTLRTAVSDADLEQWRQVRLAVVPGERAGSVAEMRAGDSPARLLLLAEQDGVLVGSGIADDSSLGGGFVGPRVLPAARRRGVGTAILGALARHCQDRGHTTAGAVVDDEVYTWTQQGNARMRAVNERLGYRYGQVSIRLESPLPLTLP